jgi:hypothetical protein
VDHSPSPPVVERTALQVPQGDQRQRIREVVDGDTTLTHDGGEVARYDHRRALVDADAQKLRAITEHLEEVELALARQQMLVHGHGPEEAEAAGSIGIHHDVVAGLGAPDQIGRQD